MSPNKFFNLVRAVTLSTFVFAGFLATPATAGVNLKNGNFYISYTDIVVLTPAGDLAISRTYNSRATTIGWFGFGWGNLYETRLSFSVDGSIDVLEHGSGATTSFFYEDSGAALEDTVEDLVKALVRGGRVKTLVQAESLQNNLLEDSGLRNGYAAYAINQGWIEPHIPPVGSVLTSNIRGFQTLEIFDDKIVRTYSDGLQHVFDLQGRLKSVRQKNGNETNLVWTQDNRRLTFVNNDGVPYLVLDFDENGLVQSAYRPGSEAERRATFEYDNKALISSIDTAQNQYIYDYDETYNMVSITYEDDTSMIIDYAPDTSFVSRIVARDGEETNYEYYGYDDPDSSPQLHYGTKVSRGGIENVYEYLIRVREDFGSQYTSEIRTYINGLLTKTEYNLCSLPVEIRRPDVTTQFEYNDDCLLTRKFSSTGEEISLEYHPDFPKITRVANDLGWTNFAYNGYGNLVFAENSGGESVSLFYDDLQRISQMIDRSGAIMQFEYNELSKPIIIRIIGVGEIRVSYDIYGEIKNVSSDQGQEMALRVTRSFQNLLSIVRPAGVNLNI